MSRLAAVLVAGLAALAPAVVAAPQAVAPASAADLPVLPAVPSDSVVDAYGIGVHLAFLDTPYANATNVADALGDLGVRHVRDDLYMRNPRQYAGIATVASRGVRFDLITGSPASPDSPAAYVDTIATQLPAGSVESVEGTNEWDLFSGGATGWAQALVTRQRDLYNATKANPATKDLPVLGPALAFKWNYAALPDLSPYADYANAHMYPGGYQPSNETTQISSALRTVIPGKPMIVTEAGYHNAVNTTNGHLPVPESVAGTYLPRLLLEHVLAGRSRVYSYELMDEFDDQGRTNPEANFGLLRRDGTRKPAYDAMKNLLGLLRDPGASFTAQGLGLKATGWPSDGKYLLVQKRDGSHVLFLWRDASIYDPVTKQPKAVTPATVTLQLASTSTVTSYRPSTAAAPVTQTQASSVTVPMDGAVTALTIQKPVAVAPARTTTTTPKTTTTTKRPITKTAVRRR